mmetsp:Transcript_17231/g.51565  ORF Transcript_17231/g.51565 Transcript_17231/m.51565 type:complete len:307 (-) Transcript_17231:5496-6416(-)
MAAMRRRRASRGSRAGTLACITSSRAPHCRWSAQAFTPGDGSFCSSAAASWSSCSMCRRVRCGWARAYDSVLPAARGGIISPRAACSAPATAASSRASTPASSRPTCTSQRSSGDSWRYPARQVARCTRSGAHCPSRHAAATPLAASCARTASGAWRDQPATWVSRLCRCPISSRHRRYPRWLPVSPPPLATTSSVGLLPRSHPGPETGAGAVAAAEGLAAAGSPVRSMTPSDWVAAEPVDAEAPADASFWSTCSWRDSASDQAPAFSAARRVSAGHGPPARSRTSPASPSGSSRPPYTSCRKATS